MTESPSALTWSRMSDLSHDLFCTFTRNGDFIFASKASDHLLGYNSKELVGRHFGEFIHPDDLAAMHLAITGALEGVPPFDFENSFIHKNGKPVLLQWSAIWTAESNAILCVAREQSALNPKPLQGVGGQGQSLGVGKQPVLANDLLMGAQTKALDMSQRLQPLKTFQKQAEEWEGILESITDGFIFLGQDFTLQYINQEGERLIQLNLKKHIGDSLFNLFPEERSGVFHQQFKAALETGHSVDFTTFLNRCNRWLRVKAYPKVKGLSVYFEDVTELVQSRKQVNLLSLVASKTNNGVVIANKEFGVEWVNAGFTNLYGYALEDIKGQLLKDFLHNHHTDSKAYFTALTEALKGEPVSIEIIHQTKAGKEIWLCLEITAIKDDQGGITGYISVQSDITSLKHSQQDLTRIARDLYKQNSDLQQFTYIVSHNLRAPVANALGLSDLLTQMDPNLPIFEESLKNLRTSVFQLDTVLRDLNLILSVRAKDGNLSKEPVDLNLKVNQVIASLQEQLMDCKGLMVNTLEEGISIMANNAYVYSIFHNLLANAIKYRSYDRPLVIQIKSFGKSEKGIIISFSDNGSGFDLNKAKGHIFKPYKRFHQDRKGSGIGLYLVKSHLEAMGGHIQVSSKVGAGTKFLIYLPVVV